MKVERVGIGKGIWLAALAVSVIVAGLVSTAVAQQPPSKDPAVWHVGFARADITPEKPIWMAGYASRNKPSEGVLARLYANALLLQDYEGNKGLIVTLDLIGFRKQVAELARKEVCKNAGLQEDQVLFNFSHTHTGPVIALDKPALYNIPVDQQEVVAEYTRKLISRLGQLAAEAVSQPRPARISWGLGVASFAMNRREFTEGGVRIGFNPRGYVDRSVPVMRIDTEEGKPWIVLFGYACHCTTLTGQHYVLSGDYAGFAQRLVEEQMPGVKAMFMIGCAADVNPWPRGQIEHAQQHGRQLAAEVCRVAQGNLRPVRGPLVTVLETVDLPLQSPDRETLEQWAKGPSYLALNARRMLQMLDEGQKLPTTFAAPFAVWQFGQDLTLVALPEETLSDYVLLVDTALGHTRLWIAGYCNEVCGYLPSAKVLAEGGYETRGLYGSQPGFFSSECQQRVLQTVVRLAEKAGRNLSGKK